VRRKDTAELLEIACERLPGVVRAPDAMKPEPPRLWEDSPDSASNNNPAGTDGEVATFAVISAIVDSSPSPARATSRCRDFERISRTIRVATAGKV
jgi:hypothetical protein